MTTTLEAPPATNAEKLALLPQLGRTFCLDTETAMAPLCFKPAQWRLLQLHNDNVSVWFDVLTLTGDEMRQLRVFLQDPGHQIYAQNVAFDFRVLMANGITLSGELFDTMIASILLYNGHAKFSHALDAIAKRELGVVLDKTLQKQDWMNAELNAADMHYAMEDVRVTWEAAHVLHEKVAAQGLYDVYRLECALVPAVVQMEHHGIYLDPSAIADTVDFYSGESVAAKECFLETLDGRLEDEGAPRLPREEDGAFNTRTKDSGSIRLGTKRFAGFNINSSQQVLAWWKFLGIEPVDDAKKPSLDKKVLARFQSDELVRMFLHYKRVEKRLGMAQKLVEHCDEDGRIRARFMPLATGTGRFSSSSPNLQQVPRDPEFRGAFKAPQGRVLVQADYNAMELRVAAAIAGEERMTAAFNEGADIHTRSASLMYGLDPSEVDKSKRQAAKALNFGALYGSGAKGVQQYCATLGLFISFNEAFDLLARWHEAYPAFGRWHQQCDNRSQAGEPVRTVTGRRRKLFGDDNRLTTQANNVVQGTSADIMKAALVEIHRQLPLSAFLVATVHDEVLVECDQGDGDAVLAIVLREMEAAAVPLLGTGIAIRAEGGVLASWGDK
jgi:DNA polymerase-1